MLSAIRDIGKWQIAKSGKKDLDVLIKEPNFKNGGKIAFIKINLDEKRFDRVELEDFDSSKINRYLFKKGSSKGNKPSPIAQIIEAEKTFKKIKIWFKKCSTTNLDSQDIVLIETVNDVLAQNETDIISKIKEKAQEIQNLPKDKRGPILLIVKIDNKYVGDYDLFSKLSKEFAENKNLEVSSANKICSVCGEEKGMIFGDNADILKFSTIDKPGFIAGGFDKTIAWKNFPLCLDCKSEIELGKGFIENKENKLSQTFVYGLNYILIPKLLIGKPQILSDVLSIFSNTKRLVSLKENVKKRITSDDNEVLDILKHESDELTLNFLFMERKSGSSSAEKILLLVENVFPSRINTIFESKDFVDKVTGKNFTFGDVRKFFLKSDEKKRNHDLDNYFLDIIDKVFRGVMIDFSFLSRFYMAKIRKDLFSYDSKSKEKYNFHSSIKSALMSLLFFESLNLIKFEEMKNMEVSKFEEVFKKYGNTFNSPIRRGLFLIGALTQMLLNKQGKERGSKPFIKKLKGLKMDERDIKALLPEVQNKFEEYNSFGKGKRLVAEEAYKYLFASEDNWKLSVDEINFFFVGGMNLVGEIKDILYAKGEKDIDLEDDVQSNEQMINKEE
ncbi:hypothetical protein METP3_02935 [Methanosarcinales archaeon]|nr:hypothetical protein METP3_02935 [Methanosarcinales archaeon]